ncbi:MAG: hypothetical protein COV48_10345, partial [Elusimicrobia bacterium CG11_big_fil_rev_8_21_14_0_20_64_6]
MVKTQINHSYKVLALGAILTFGLPGLRARALVSSTVDDDANSGWAQEIASDTAANKTDRERLEAVPPDSTQAREIRRVIAQRGEKADEYAQRAPTNVPVLTAAADQALGNGDIVRAQGRADQAVLAASTETDPAQYAKKWPSAMNMRSKIAEAAGDYRRANALAAEVLKKFPDNRDAQSLYYLTKGRALAGSTHSTAAPASAPAAAPAPVRPPPAAAVAPVPNVQAYLDRSATLIGMRDFIGALGAAQKAAALSPANPDPHMLQAAAWAALKNISEAILAISRAIERLAEGDPRLPIAYNTRAMYKNRAGDYAGAVADTDDAIRRDPVFADAYYQRSQAQKALGHAAASLADIQKAAELRPADYKSLYDVAAREMSEGGAQAPSQARNGSFWEKLTASAGGGFRLLIGAMGALFVLFAGCIFFFARGNSPMRTLSRLFTPSSRTQALAAEAEDVPVALNGKYVRGKLVGSGGMGDVFEGQDNTLRRRVAIKRLRPELQGRKRERERFIG